MTWAAAVSWYTALEVHEVIAGALLLFCAGAWCWSTMAQNKELKEKKDDRR